MSDGPTKAELVERLAESTAELDRVRHRLDTLDDEARAIDVCVKALKRIAPSGSTVSRRYEPSVRRVLRTVADRYGVPLTDTVTEPCDREHLEDAPDERLIERLRGWT